MKLATTIGDFDGVVHSPAEAVAAFEGTGFRHLDYDFYSVLFPGSPFLGDRWLDAPIEAAEVAARLGFDLVQAHAPDYNPLDARADHEAGMTATLRSIEACGRLGIPHMVIHPGYCDELTYPEGREEYVRRNIAFFEKLLPALEKHGVTACVENSAEANMGRRYFFMTGEEIADFCERMHHPLIEGCFDVGHANLRPVSLYRELVDLGGHLRALHIQDNDGSCDEHMAPLCGTLDVDAVMQALLKIGYDGYFTMEATNLLRSSEWPHPLKTAPEVTERRLARPSLELKRQAERLLYEIGKHILEQYDCFEE